MLESAMEAAQNARPSAKIFREFGDKTKRDPTMFDRPAFWQRRVPPGPGWTTSGLSVSFDQH